MASLSSTISSTVKEVECRVVRTVTSSSREGTRPKKGMSVAIKLDPTQIVVEQIGSLFQSEISTGTLETHATVVRAQRESVSSRVSTVVDETSQPIPVAKVNSELENDLGWKPSSPPEANSTVVSDMRPKPFFPLTGKKGSVPVPKSALDVRAASPSPHPLAPLRALVTVRAARRAAHGRVVHGRLPLARVPLRRGEGPQGQHRPARRGRGRVL